MHLNSEAATSLGVLDQVTFLVGSKDLTSQLSAIPALTPFDDRIVDFLNDVSQELMRSKAAKDYSDVVSYAFWIRKSSILKLKERFGLREGVHLGRGVVFHIAPSNVPVNFAYSLAVGLLTGNANVVRVPSKEFTQVEIIIEAINRILDRHERVKPYVLCIRYGKNKDINDFFSSVADMRVVWGGDQTIAELRKSPLSPRAGEITFADRYSLAVINADEYLNTENKVKVAEDFYNDTFFSDQNACTSPRVVVWMGEKIERAKDIFWKTEHELVKKKYNFQPIQGVNKLTQGYLVAASESGVKIEKHDDNLIVRVKVPEVTDHLMDYRDNSGYFYEYDCRDILSLTPLVNDKRCQTIAYIGNKEMFLPLIKKGVKGIDRIVPIGKTMDFDLIWDGYDLPALLTRTVVMV